MIKVKTSELTGVALDWAVAKCEGYQAVFTNGSIRPVFRKSEAVEDTWPNYSTDWAKGGPIIERECIELTTTNRSNNELWEAIGRGFGEDCPTGYGPTPLIAAMRCYVASKLGDIVEIPKELTKEITSC
jgi:hypothetical protein